MKRILVAGIGNIFMGDDAFGCEVIRRLEREPMPANVEVADFGIRGMDLGYALADGRYALAILVDTVARGGKPGTTYVIEPDIEAAKPGTQPIVPHGMDPQRVLRFAAAFGTHCPRVLLVACEPETLGGEAGRMGLSAPVAGAIERAVAEILAILETNGAASAPANIYNGAMLQEA
jgi:hydrogenase maturation protease